MRRPRALAAAPAALAALALVAAGCGAGGGSPGPTTGTGAATRTAPATVTTAHTKLGTVLVDAQGRTLYLFEKDKGMASSCTGTCASIWPPVTGSAKNVARGGLGSGKLGSVARADGTREVTYAGHPLYTYAGDGKPGDVKGQGLDQFGAGWYVLAPSGQKIDQG